MGNFISLHKINDFIICSTLGAFFFSTLTFPLHAIPIPNGANINLNDINFAVRLEKLVEKTKKYYSNKNSHKLNEIMWEIKNEVEIYTGNKINIDSHLDLIEKKAKSAGQPINKKYIKELRNRFKKQEKRLNHKKNHIKNCIIFDIPYNSEEEQLIFQNENSFDHLVLAKNSHGKQKDNENEDEIILPLRVTIGVTMSLVGLFLYVVPHPYCRAAAPWVLDTGLAFLLDQGVTEWEERKKEDKNK